MNKYHDMIDRMCDLAEGGNIYTKANYQRLLRDLGITRDEAKVICVTGLTLDIFEVFCTEPEMEEAEGAPV